MPNLTRCFDVRYAVELDVVVPPPVGGAEIDLPTQDLPSPENMVLDGVTTEDAHSGESVLVTALELLERTYNDGLAPDGSGAGSVPELLLWLLLIHRGGDGYITFERRTPRGDADPRHWQTLYSVRVDEVASRWDKITPSLSEEAYFGINSMWRAGRRPSKEAGLSTVWRREVGLRYLNLCYVDLDVGRPHSRRRAQCQSWQEAAARAENLMKTGKLPPVSLVVRSGRGLWLCWLLADEQQPEQPPRAWPEVIQLYKQINRAIGKSLTALAADSVAHDAARLLRLPGSRHRTSRLPALYVACTVQGQVPTYTLAQLADFFDVNTERPNVARRRTQQPGTAPQRRHGQQQLHAHRFHDLLLLEGHHGGWRKGQRRFWLQLGTTFLRGAGASSQEALLQVELMAQRCRPPYPSEDNDTPLAKLVKEVFAKPLHSYTNAKLVHWLRVTPELARTLNLRTIVPEEITLERRPPGGRRGQQQAARRAFIEDYCVQHCEQDISCRKLQHALQQAGFQVSHETVNQDLRGLRLASSRLAVTSSTIPAAEVIAEKSLDGVENS